MPIQTLLRKISGIEDLEIFLELLDKPALIWNRPRGVIEACNAEFIKFSGYSRKDIDSLDTADIFPGLILSENDPLPAPSVMRLASSIQLDILSEIKPLQNEKNLSVILIDAPQPTAVEQSMASHESKWEAISLLLNAPLAPSLKAAFKNTLIAGQKLVECEYMAIYLPIPGSESKYIQIDNLGECDFLPEIINIEDINHLRIPVIWTLGSPTTSILHQSALTAHQSYLATCPLDPESSLDGLLTIGSGQNPPPQNILPVSAMVSQTISTCMDFHEVVTESEKELKETNYQLEIVRTIRNQISEGIIFVDTDFKIIDLNTSSSMILGYSENEMLDQPLEKILVCNREITEVLKQAEGKDILVHDLGESTVKHRDGKAIPVLIRTIPLISESGPNATAILFSDLSTLKQFETRSRQLETQANIGEMIAVFAHEVRNPINNIRMGVENFSAYFESDEEAKDEIDRILGDVDRLSDLMKSILTAYRTKEYKMESIHLSGFIEGILFRWKPRMTRYRVSPSIENRNIDGLISGDKRSLEQVFTNIIQNAIDAMKDTGGNLTVRITEEGDNVQVDIADTGPGIPTDIQEKIFNLYYTTRQNGNGIGLAITKQIVDAHNGHISVTSVPGGTVFRISLPKAKISQKIEEFE